MIFAVPHVKIIRSTGEKQEFSETYLKSWLIDFQLDWVRSFILARYPVQQWKSLL